MIQRRDWLSREKIDSQAANYPTVRLIGGEDYPVDECGLIVVGRRWPIYRPPTQDYIDRAAAWCRLAESHQIKTPTVSSYGAKHTAETWARGYISNGALIVAAGRHGFSMERDEFNTVIAISLRWYRKHRQSVYEQGATNA